MSVKFMTNSDHVFTSNPTTDVQGSITVGSRFKDWDKTSQTSILVLKKQQNQSQPALQSALSKRRVVTHEKWHHFDKSWQQRQSQASEAAIANTVIGFYKGTVSAQAHRQTSMDRIANKAKQGFQTSYKQSIATTKDCSLANIISQVHVRKNQSFFLDSHKPYSKKEASVISKTSNAQLSPVSLRQGEQFSCIEQERVASMRLSKLRLNISRKPSLRARRGPVSIDLQNEELRRSLLDCKQQTETNNEKLKELNKSLREVKVMGHDFISSFKKKQLGSDHPKTKGLNSPQAARHGGSKQRIEIEVENVDPEPKLLTQFRDEMKKQVVINKSNSLKSIDSSLSSDNSDLSDTQSQKTYLDYMKRTKKEHLCFRLEQTDSRELKDLKYAMRIQDLQKLVRKDPAIITPDPRLRSPDRMVVVDIFDGDFRASKDKEKKNLMILGDPRKKQTEFMADLNTIAWQTAIVKKRHDKVNKSDSLNLARNKITQEVRDKRAHLADKLGEKLKMVFIDQYASLIEGTNTRKNSMILQQPEGQQIPIREMGLFSLIKKNLMEMQQKAAAQGESALVDYQDAFASLDVAVRKRGPRKSLIEPSYYKMYQDKIQEVKRSQTIEKSAAQRWVNQTKMLEHQIRIHREKLHEINKIVGLIKGDSSKIPTYKYEKIHEKFKTKQVQTIKIEQHGNFEEPGRSKTTDVSALSPRLKF